jgi:hypothetical protein
MPTAATVDGIKIQFYYDEHPPPHFHAIAAEYRASIDIATLEVVEGWLPRAQLRKVKSWAESRQEGLLVAWGRCRADQAPGDVE